jgi:hypothetical protein
MTRGCKGVEAGATMGIRMLMSERWRNPIWGGGVTKNPWPISSDVHS